MRFSTRFTIATHILLCVGYFQDETKVTSDFLAGSVSVNPVIIRNLLAALSKAGLVRVTPGVGGACLAKPPESVTLLDIFRAVEKDEPLFHFHENPNPDCPVGGNIHRVLDKRMNNIEDAMEDEMAKVTLAQLLREIRENK